MTEVRFYDESALPAKEEKKAIIDFLFTHLDQFGDAWADIEKAVNYALKVWPSFGGYVLAGFEQDKIIGAVVVNRTGMQGYIPENILVYIATHGLHRGRGVGKELMQRAIDRAEGSIALHVEPDNPARFLYEKLGFTNKYLEMRLARK